MSQYPFCFMFWFFGLETCGILAPQPGTEPALPPLEGRSTTLNDDLSATETWTSEIRDSYGQKEPLLLHVPTFPQKWIRLYLSRLRHRAVNAGAFIWKGNPPPIVTRLEKTSKNLDMIAA